MSSLSGYDLAAAVLYGLSALAITVLFLISLSLIRRHNDPARLPFLWLKLAMPFFLISVLLSTADEVIVLVIQSTDGDVALSLIDATWRLSDLGGLFSNLADNIIVLCLVELGLGFLRAFDKVGTYQQIIRYSTVFVVVILFALTFAVEGTNEDLITRFDHGSNYNVDWTTVDNLFAAYYILYWIFSVPIVIFSAVVLFFSLRRKYLQTISACFLAASLSNLIRTTWDLVYAVNYEINYDPFYTIIPKSVIVLFPILYVWVTVALFTLVIVIGVKKSNGLWSDQQHLYGNSGLVHGTPASRPAGAISYMQPTQPEIVGAAATPWRPELNGGNYINPTQQNYGTYYQQQQPITQNQLPQTYHVAGT